MTRAKIVLLAAAGWTNRGIARKLGLAPNTAGKWRKRFSQEGADGLRDRKRPGRPRAFPAAVVAACKAIACELPATRGVPLGRWSLAELRTEVLATGLIDDVSTTTLWRWLDEDPIKPWQHRSWIFPRDPDFAAKAGVVLDLYDRAFQGQELEPDAYVVSADEKTSIQAAAAATRACHQGWRGRSGSSTSTSAAARWPTWPPGTCTRHDCSAAASRRPASSPSAGWWSR